MRRSARRSSRKRGRARRTNRGTKRTRRGKHIVSELSEELSDTLPLPHITTEPQKPKKTKKKSYPKKKKSKKHKKHKQHTPIYKIPKKGKKSMKQKKAKVKQPKKKNYKKKFKMKGGASSSLANPRCGMQDGDPRPCWDELFLEEDYPIKTYLRNVLSAMGYTKETWNAKEEAPGWSRVGASWLGERPDVLWDDKELNKATTITLRQALDAVGFTEETWDAHDKNLEYRLSVIEPPLLEPDDRRSELRGLRGLRLDEDANVVETGDDADLL